MSKSSSNSARKLDLQKNGKPCSRKKRMAEIRAQIEAGTYRRSSEEVAKALLKRIFN